MEIATIPFLYLLVSIKAIVNPKTYSKSLNKNKDNQSNSYE